MSEPPWAGALATLSLLLSSCSHVVPNVDSGGFAVVEMVVSEAVSSVDTRLSSLPSSQELVSTLLTPTAFAQESESTETAPAPEESLDRGESSASRHDYILLLRLIFWSPAFCGEVTNESRLGSSVIFSRKCIGEMVALARKLERGLTHRSMAVRVSCFWIRK